MAIHPPLLYLGFVGLAVPFALTVDALIRGRLDADWLRLARRWTLGPWVFLTLGLVAGAWWSYAVLGWGGYWGWDPVENVVRPPRASDEAEREEDPRPERPAAGKSQPVRVEATTNEGVDR